MMQPRVYWGVGGTREHIYLYREGCGRLTCELHRALLSHSTASLGNYTIISVLLKKKLGVREWARLTLGAMLQQ